MLNSCKFSIDLCRIVLEDANVAVGADPRVCPIRAGAGARPYVFFRVLKCVYSEDKMTIFNDVLFSEEEARHGFLGVITLNKPQAYNALSHDMILHITQQLEHWSKNKRLLAVMIHSAFEKAFCAGGDIRSLYDAGKRGDSEALRAFFCDEYRMIHRINIYPKPWISFINGITMGGGVGISIHGRHRVATETLRFAMPECAIGFFPDVGGSYFLSRCPGELGTYLGLTGASINAADALYCGLIDHCITAENYTAVKMQLLDTDFSNAVDVNKVIADILKQHAIKTEESALAEKRELIDKHFQGNSVEAILRSLQQEPSPWCQELAVILQQKSPFSLKVTLAQLRRGKALSLDACLQMEYNIAQHFSVSKDFYEGVRAQIIDKDKTPHWQPAPLDAVRDDAVAVYFDSVATNELELS